MNINSKLILPVLTLLIVSCAQGPENRVTITGQVSNLSETFYFLSHPGGGLDTIRPDATGNFTILLDPVEEPADYTFVTQGNFYSAIHVVPGMKTEMSFDGKDFPNSLRFSGDGADINNYIVAKSQHQRVDTYGWYKLDASEYRVKQDSMLAVYQGLLNEVKKEDPSDPYWAKEEAEILFGWAGDLDRYETYHRYVVKQPDYQVPEGFRDYMKELNVNNAKYVESRAFQSYLTQLIGNMAAKREKSVLDKDSTVEVNIGQIKREVAIELVTEPAVLNVYLLNVVKNGLQWEEINAVQQDIDLFKEKCKDKALLKEFETEYDGWKKLDKGQPAPEIIGKNMQGETVKLSDFRGKYLYLDLWATWCGPCNYEIPFLDSLETDYHGRNIVFMSYSIDDDHDAWMKFVPEKQLKGIQIIGDKGWASQICKDYKILGVPTFMFFDPEGNIISVKMTRPSDKQTRETFNSYPDL